MKTLTVCLLLSLACQARPELSQDEARALFRSGQTLRTTAPPPRPMVYFGELNSWTPTRASKDGAGFWRTAGQDGFLEQELPAGLRGRTFRLELEGHVQGGLSVVFLGPDGVELREVLRYSSPDGLLPIRKDTHFTAPPAGAKLRVELGPNSQLRLEALKAYRAD